MLAIAILQGLLWDLLSGVVVMVLDFLIICQANFYMGKGLSGSKSQFLDNFLIPFQNVLLHSVIICAEHITGMSLKL